MGDSDQVTKLRMVGLSLLCYVSAHLQQNIGEIDCDRVKTGIEGLGGNKGGATRFDVAMGLSVALVENVVWNHLEWGGFLNAIRCSML